MDSMADAMREDVEEVAAPPPHQSSRASPCAWNRSDEKRQANARRETNDLQAGPVAVLPPLSQGSQPFGTRFVLSPRPRSVPPHAILKARWGRMPAQRHRSAGIAGLRSSLKYDSGRDHIARRNELFALFHE
jgi:hypothetical protein